MVEEAFAAGSCGQSGGMTSSPQYEICSVLSMNQHRLAHIMNQENQKKSVAMNGPYLTLIRSTRVTDRTREVLLQRALSPDRGYVPQSVSRSSFAVLRAVVQRLIPQAEGEDFIDIAATLDAGLSGGRGDGWRYASMPPDDVALALGLQLIETTAQSQHDLSFTALDPADQDALLSKVQKGELLSPGLDASRWFEDLLAEATEIYVSHPATLAAMGFSGIAFLPRWPQIGLNMAQSWEPKPMNREKCADTKRLK